MDNLYAEGSPEQLVIAHEKSQDWQTVEAVAQESILPIEGLDGVPSILANAEPAGPTYGRDLWDQLPVIKESTDLRVKQMQAIRNFFRTYRKSLDLFKDGVKKALLQFEKEVIVPQSKKGYKIGQKAQNFPQTKKN